MKSIIRKILIEGSKLNILKKYLIKTWNDQVKSGKIPMLNIIDLHRKNLSNHIDEIIKCYFEFVGGEEEAFKLFKKYIDGKIITDVGVRNMGLKVLPEDQYKIKITRIYNLDYRGNRILGSNEELEFGFELLSGQFLTSEGILTLEELYDEKYEHLWFDVRDYLRTELEDYVWSVSKNFGLEFDAYTSYSRD